jgi:hypothetical protein
VRKGARWRRDSATKDDPAFIEPEYLEERLDGLAKHRGRTWTDSDHRTKRILELQSWGLVEVSDRRITIPQWLRGEAHRADTGEAIELVDNPRMRMMLAIVWSAAEAGAFGVYCTREGWAQILECSVRTVSRYFRELLARKLIRVRQCLAMHRGHSGEALAGSQDAACLLRLGPALDDVAIALYERAAVRAPRGAVHRPTARAVAVALRQGMRDAGRASYRARPTAAPQAPLAPSVRDPGADKMSTLSAAQQSCAATGTAGEAPTSGGTPPGPPGNAVARFAPAALVVAEARPRAVTPPSRAASSAAPGRMLGTGSKPRAKPGFADMIAALATTLDELGSGSFADAARDGLAAIDRERWRDERRRAVLDDDDEGGP